MGATGPTVLVRRLYPCSRSRRNSAPWVVDPARHSSSIIRVPSVMRSVIDPRSAANRVTIFNNSPEEGAKIFVLDGRDVITKRVRKDAVRSTRGNTYGA